VSPAGGGGDRALHGRPHELVRLVTRLAVAQTVAAAAVGLLFSRRHLPSIIMTLVLMAALGMLTLLVRRGGQAAWLMAIGAESAYVVFGVWRFVTARYVGGTLMGIIVLGTLLHPSVARAFAAWRHAAVPGGAATGGQDVPAAGDSLLAGPDALHAREGCGEGPIERRALG
jgi:uncharacterized membrane protein (UPF0136 family)